MKRVLVIVLLLTITKAAGAQTVNEWIRQRHTQIAYYLKQILLLRQHNDLLRASYSILSGGLAHTDSLKRQDFAQHDDYFRSWRQVSDGIRSSATRRYWLKRLDEADRILRQHDGSMATGFREAGNLLRREHDASLSDHYLSMPEPQRVQLVQSWCAAVKKFCGDVQVNFADDQLFRLHQRRSLDELHLLEKIHQP